MGFLPVAKGVVPRELLEQTTIDKSDIPLLEKFFENEYHTFSTDQKAIDLITNIECWVIQRLEQKFATNTQMLLIDFLVELGKEQFVYYNNWDSKKLSVLSSLNCEDDSTEFTQDDLVKVNSLKIPGRVLDKDKRALATLYEIAKDNNIKIVYASTDYSIVLSRSLIEPQLNFLISDPLYVVQKLENMK